MFKRVSLLYLKEITKNSTMKRRTSSRIAQSGNGAKAKPAKNAKKSTLVVDDADDNADGAASASSSSVSAGGGRKSSRNAVLKNFIKSLQERREKAGASITDFAFNKKRVRVLSEASEVKETGTAVCYWMSRDMRVQDNWAFLYAQRLALRLALPLVVAYSVTPIGDNISERHYRFLLDGLKEVAAECELLNIPFYLLLGSPALRIPELVDKHNLRAVVCDFSPLRLALSWLEDVKSALPLDVPLVQVDAHNVLPVWHVSDKQEYSARTIRGKINAKLEQFLTEFPPLIRHPYEGKLPFVPVDWAAALKSLKCSNAPAGVDEVEWAKPGYMGACEQLEGFLVSRLRIYNDNRNDPTNDALSGLSPWFHFGQISVQRCVLEVMRLKSKYKASVDAFCEEAIVRRELADNFCYYNEHYDSLEGLHEWARKTLDDHRKDERNPCYSLSEFEQARTHDDLWNSAQLQLLREGKMHGFLRMYWAKKILEWTATPEQALEIAILLNDKYSLDGVDPNGYVGCMWSIGGVHDQGWAERPIFGKIRYMNYQGCERKFNVASFVTHYGGKKHMR